MSKSVHEIKTCNICNGSNVRKTSNSEIYGREFGNGMCFLCDDCRSYVGCHPDGRSLGILSNHEMREKKKQCHALFDPIWKSKKIKRGDLYGVLADLLKIDKRECHFGWFDTDRLNQAIEAMSKNFWYVQRG